jgi:hypothetical protein
MNSRNMEGLDKKVRITSSRKKIRLFSKVRQKTLKTEDSKNDLTYILTNYVNFFILKIVLAESWFV